MLSGLGLLLHPLGLQVQGGAFSPDSGGTVSLMILGPGQVITWNGVNDAGGLVEGGSYYVKMEITDPFGAVEAYNDQVSVVREALGVAVEIYNTAGERVWRGGGQGGIQSLTLGSPSFSPDPAGLNPLAIQWGSGPLQNVSWDGRNEQGELVESGTYAVRARDLKTGAVLVQELALIKPSLAPALLPRAWPMPATLKNPLVVIELPGAPPGTLAQAGIYNSAGERIAAGVNSPWPDRILWNSSGLASGTYFAVIEIREINGAASRRILKMAVLR